MKKGRSFDKINYLIRPNKHIERKLIFDALSKANSVFDLSKHRYIGFGSFWFVDFMLAHRIIGLNDMWSIEHEEYEKRANFNRPYASIRILPGRSSTVFREIASEDWEQPNITWLDYDGVFDEDAASDIDILTRKSSQTSFLIITVNGNRSSYRTTNPDGKKNISLDMLDKIAGSHNLPFRTKSYRVTGAGEKIDIPESDFPQILSETILNMMKHKVTSSGRIFNGKPATFLPLFNFCHVDGTEMVTVGGAIISSEEIEKLKNILNESCYLDHSNGLPKHLKLDLVQLTVKEKMALDRILPNKESEFEEMAKQEGIELNEDQLRKYRNCYRYFPIFAESFF